MEIENRYVLNRLENVNIRNLIDFRKFDNRKIYTANQCESL